MCLKFCTTTRVAGASTPPPPQIGLVRFLAFQTHFRVIFDDISNVNICDNQFVVVAKHVKQSLPFYAGHTVRMMNFVVWYLQ